MTSGPPVVVGRRTVAPDPSITSAVGRHHSFETAIADLVDNSVDAAATQVLLRFLQLNGAVTGFQIIDNGHGMDSEALDQAMTFAKKREYGGKDLGHFGIGMKAASLSQADILRVYSRRDGAQAAGRSIRAAAPTEVEELEYAGVDSYLAAFKLDFPLATGTVVEWAEPRTFLTATNEDDRARWLDERIGAIRTHLGIVFHRILEAEKLTVTIEVFDIVRGRPGVPRTVEPINPFAYRQVGQGPFPAQLTITIDRATVRGRVHLWPAAQSGLPSYRLNGRPGSLAQGFFFYRNDRLLQMGGWNTLTVNRPELEFARIELDIDESVSDHIAINPEKAGLELDSDLKAAILEAMVGQQGQRFADFLEVAESTRHESRRYTKRAVTLVEPFRGFSADMLDAFSASVEFSDHAAVDIRWEVQDSEDPIRVDLAQRSIWLNARYRGVIVGHESGDNYDAPLVKTLLLLVFSRYFEGDMLGSREKAEIAAWQQLLTAALRDEIAAQARRMGKVSNE
ncbi:ATP-binding protein [Cryobacterium sp. PH31-L1]|uniref:ATP-binding protein n=1 Tax=Cryobacterium sp. PH31-L1 TaxID=3046199 RepID=UPI0024BBA8D7|nr:ATP-binding protein [Cryobacterium sp. PH31-L1]MDJ0378490.1 ATP-binding protein [Cryobacterium sp. PH31-L1]